MDYETLPFRCCICHEYGHLLHKCPRFKPSPANASGPLKGDKEKDPTSTDLGDNKGFTQVKSCNRGKGKKRTGQDRHNDSTFNRFDVLEDLIQEEGILVELSSRDKGLKEVQEEEEKKDDHVLPSEDLQYAQIDMDL